MRSHHIWYLLLALAGQFGGFNYFSIIISGFFAPGPIPPLPGMKPGGGGGLAASASLPRTLRHPSTTAAIAHLTGPQPAPVEVPDLPPSAPPVDDFLAGRRRQIDSLASALEGVVTEEATSGKIPVPTNTAPPPSGSGPPPTTGTSLLSSAAGSHPDLDSNPSLDHTERNNSSGVQKRALSPSGPTGGPSSSAADLHRETGSEVIRELSGVPLASKKARIEGTSSAAVASTPVDPPSRTVPLTDPEHHGDKPVVPEHTEKTVVVPSEGLVGRQGGAQGDGSAPVGSLMPEKDNVKAAISGRGESRERDKEKEKEKERERERERDKARKEKEREREREKERERGSYGRKSAYVPRCQRKDRRYDSSSTSDESGSSSSGRSRSRSRSRSKSISRYGRRSSRSDRGREDRKERSRSRSRSDRREPQISKARVAPSPSTVPISKSATLSTAQTAAPGGGSAPTSAAQAAVPGGGSAPSATAQAAAPGRGSSTTAPRQRWDVVAPHLLPLAAQAPPPRAAEAPLSQAAEAPSSQTAQAPPSQLTASPWQEDLSPDRQEGEVILSSMQSHPLPMQIGGMQHASASASQEAPDVQTASAPLIPSFVADVQVPYMGQQPFPFPVFNPYQQPFVQPNFNVFPFSMPTFDMFCNSMGMHQMNMPPPSFPPPILPYPLHAVNELQQHLPEPSDSFFDSSRADPPRTECQPQECIKQSVDIDMDIVDTDMASAPSTLDSQTNEWGAQQFSQSHPYASEELAYGQQQGHLQQSNPAGSISLKLLKQYKTKYNYLRKENNWSFKDLTQWIVRNFGVSSLPIATSSPASPRPPVAMVCPPSTSSLPVVVSSLASSSTRAALPPPEALVASQLPHQSAALGASAYRQPSAIIAAPPPPTPAPPGCKLPWPNSKPLLLQNCRPAVSTLMCFKAFRVCATVEEIFAKRSTCSDAPSAGGGKAGPSPVWSRAPLLVGSAANANANAGGASTRIIGEALDPLWPVCKFDVRGDCKDKRCHMQVGGCGGNRSVGRCHRAMRPLGDPEVHKLWCMLQLCLERFRFLFLC